MCVLVRACVGGSVCVYVLLSVYMDTYVQAQCMPAAQVCYRSLVTLSDCPLTGIPGREEEDGGA